MKSTRRKPCGNCPFRKEAPLAHWHPDEYLMLQRMQRGEAGAEQVGMGRGLFGCHKDVSEEPEDRELCVGWLIHQRENNLPSIALRMKLMTDDDAGTQFKECEPDGEQYDDIDELVRDNIKRDMQLNPERYEGDEA